ncbi:hypothetical protein [Sorangium sp. So ce131]|uniref:hypothetical protein n=1 Tax=Sorangium sp. So ce131 TaxID=3133282 RepID=UPI003F63451B
MEAGTDIRTTQTLLGHKDVRTTMIYTYIVDRDLLGVLSPLYRDGRHLAATGRTLPRAAPAHASGKAARGGDAAGPDGP